MWASQGQGQGVRITTLDQHPGKMQARLCITSPFAITNINANQNTGTNHCEKMLTGHPKQNVGDKQQVSQGQKPFVLWLRWDLYLGYNNTACRKFTTETSTYVFLLIANCTAVKILCFVDVIWLTENAKYQSWHQLYK